MEHPPKGLESEVVGSFMAIANPSTGKRELSCDYPLGHQYTQEEVEAFVRNVYGKTKKPYHSTVYVGVLPKYKPSPKKQEDTYYYSPTWDAELEYIPYNEIM